MTTPNAIAGKRILIVEDEMLVAVLVEDTLADYGGDIIGVAATLREARRFATSEDFDAAVMDVNLAGESVHPVAEILENRGIPFIFVSGYGQSAVPKSKPNWRICAKPFRGNELAEFLSTQILCTRP